MRVPAGKIIGEIPFDEGSSILLSIPCPEDAKEIMELYNSLSDDYVGSDLHYKDINNLIERIKVRQREIEKGKYVQFLGWLRGELILSANMRKNKIRSGKDKGKYCGEIAIIIKKGYRKKGIGGKVMDLFIKKAREMKMVYVFGRFFHENFDSLVLCKSRKLRIYRVEKNNSIFDKKWKKRYYKWGKAFDRVNARLYL
ncbi:MAG: hypothetical protein QXO69_00830 [archaeon]